MAKTMRGRDNLAGFAELDSGLEHLATNLHGPDVIRGMWRMVSLLQGEAKKQANKDLGRMADEISTTVFTQPPGAIVGQVGSTVFYAPFVEFGTRPHWPPPGALAGWAYRHGMSEYVIRRAIALRGTKAYRFYEKTLDAKVVDIIRVFVGAVEDAIRGG